MVRYRLNAALIKQLRLRKGKTLLQMAIDADLQPGTITKLENHGQIDCASGTLRKIADYFKMDMKDLQILE